MSRAEFEEWMRKHEPSIPLDYGKDGPWYDWQDAGSYFALAKAATEAAAKKHVERCGHEESSVRGDPHFCNSEYERGWIDACQQLAAAIRGESDE